MNETRVNWSENLTITTEALDNFGGATPPSSSTLIFPPYSPSKYNAEVSLGYPIGYQVGPGGVNKPRQVNLVDGLSYAVGAHQLKFGADYLRSLPIVGEAPIFYYYFPSVSDAVNNDNLSFGNFGETLVRGDATNLSLYAQDAWKASRGLTLTYGLRWDLNPPAHDRYPKNGNYVPLLGNYLTGDVSVGAAGSTLWNPQYKNFAPRVGLAYQIRQTPGWETVLRAGIGLFYDAADRKGRNTALQPGFPRFPRRFQRRAFASFKFLCGGYTSDQSDGSGPG